MRELNTGEITAVTGGYTRIYSSFGGFVNTQDNLAYYQEQQKERAFLEANPTMNSADYNGY